MKLLKYLPDYMAEIYEISEIMNAEDYEIERLMDNCDEIQNEMFVERASEYGISRLEKLFKIEDNSSDLQFRRFRLMMRLSGKTKEYIIEKLDSIVGEGKYQLNFDLSEMTMTVKVTVEQKGYLDEIRNYLDKVLPCNVILNVLILYSSHKMLGKHTHSELSSYQYSELRFVDIEQQL